MGVKKNNSINDFDFILFLSPQTLSIGFPRHKMLILKRIYANTIPQQVNLTGSSINKYKRLP